MGAHYTRVNTVSWINKHQFQGKALPEEITHISADEILEEMLIMSADLPLTRHGKDVSDSEEPEQKDVAMQSLEDNFVPESGHDQEMRVLYLQLPKAKINPANK